MSKLAEKIKHWVEAGLINQDQAESILKYEDERPSNNWLMYGFLGLGAFVIIIGVISIIAANWEVIPASIKLTTHFSAFAGFIWLTLRWHQQQKEIYFEVMIAFLALFSIASIGLISQIYHTGGALYQAGLLWSAINFGFLFLTTRSIIPSLWGGIFFLSLTLFVWNDPHLKEVYGRNLLPLYLGLPFFCLLFTLLFKRVNGEGAVTNVFRKICFLTGVLGLLMAESKVTYLYQKSYSLQSFLPSYFLIIFGCVYLVKSQLYRASQKKLLLALIFLYTIALHLPVLRFDNAFLLAALSILILSLSAIYMGSLKYKKLFETFLVLLFLRFYFLYLQAFGGLAQTGIGLIISGLVMIAMVLFWHRKRAQISKWADEVMQ